VDSADVKAFFERVSVEWDEMRSSFYNEGVDRRVGRPAHRSAGTHVWPTSGPAPGFVAAGLAPQAHSVVGVDSSPAMLDVAARPCALDADTLARRARGESVTAIARHLGLGRSTLYRALGEPQPT